MGNVWASSCKNHGNLIEIEHVLTHENYKKLGRYFKPGETTLSHDVLLSRQRKHALDKLFMDKLIQMCKRINEL